MKKPRPLTENPGCFSLLTRKSKSNNTIISKLNYSITHSPAEEEDSFPYTTNDHFLSNAELSFYLQAREVLSDKYILCPQVSLASLLNISVKEYRENQIAFNRISRKRIDFAVCEAETMKVLYAIELDDSSHNRKNRQERDEFVNQAFAAAGLTLLHVDCKRGYSQQEMINVLFAPIKQKRAVSAASPTLQPAPLRENTTLPSAIPPLLPTENGEIGLTACSVCGAPMKKKAVTAGAHKGEYYWVCSQYPKCQNFFPAGERLK